MQALRNYYGVMQFLRNYYGVMHFLWEEIVQGYISEFQNKLAWRFGISVSPPLE